MHYVGMLAFRLPIPVSYHWPTVLLSLLAAVFNSLVGFFIVSRPIVRTIEVWSGSIFMGAAIVTLHYTAMAAMRLQATCRYDPTFVGLSIAFAVAGAWLSLRFGFVFRDEASGRKLRKFGSALLMGAAIVTMHYTAMAAASFSRTAVVPDLSHAVSISFLGSVGIGATSTMVLIATLLTALIDRLQTQSALLDELFEQAPQAVALVKRDYRVVRVNREFTRLFGYAPHEILGRRLIDLIAPDELHAEVERNWESVARGQRVEAESVRRRKDGSRLHVALILVPFQVPDRETAVYAIYRDITERKESDDALRELSGHLLRLQDEERRRLARELHDSTGQKLAALAINLAVMNESEAVLDERARRALAESLALIDECFREIRTLSYLLHPPELDEFGLPDALSHYVNGFAERSGIPVDLDISAEVGRLPREVETALFRIVQEALNNIYRHSGARRAEIRISRGAMDVTMEIRDEGHGMGESATTGAVQTPVTGVGIAGMRERVKQLNGQFEIHSAESGTTLRVVIPLAQD
jgi:PAS domain S-box-containing protein